jgi:hypothetical protein
MAHLTTPYARLAPASLDASDAALHAMLGMGVGWVAMPALSIEAATLQLSQPEGLAIAALTGTAGTIGSTVIVPLFLLVQRYATLSSARWVQISLALQTAAMLLGVVGAHWTMGGMSVVLYLVAFLSSLAANLQRLAAMPWVLTSGLPPGAVSWLLTGGNATSLFCALLGVLQQPGGAERFSVGAYFGCLALLLAIAIGAYAVLAMRRAVRGPPVTPSLGKPSAVAVSGVASADGAEAGSSCCGMPAFASHPTVLACTLTNALVQYICWIVMGFLLPYAAKHAVTQPLSEEGGSGEGSAAASGESSVLLGYTAELSTVAVFLGSLVSTVVPNDALHCGGTIAVMTACLAAIIALILDALPLATSPTARAGVLVVAATSARFVDGLVTPLLYRRAGDPFPSRMREAVSRFQGAVSIASTAVGTWGVVWLVQAGVLK